MRYVLLVLAVFAVAVAPVRADAPPINRASVAIVGTICTGTAIRINLIMTASHCVGAPGQEVPVRFRLGDAATDEYQVFEGVVVWDSAFRSEEEQKAFQPDVGLDLAFIRIKGSWRFVAQFAAELPPDNTELDHWSYGLGFHYWRARLKYVGLWARDDLGNVLVYRGDTFPGASGSAVFWNDRIIGIITHGASAAQPPLFLGAWYERLQAGLANLETKGDMYPCQLPDGTKGFCRKKPS